MTVPVDIPAPEISPITPPPPSHTSAVTANVTAAVLGLAAFSASYVHVVRLARQSGQTGWVAYAIATSIELMAMAAIAEIRHRGQRGEPARWPRCVLVLGTVMSLGANLATAKVSPWGYIMAAWPSLAFLAVAGIVETRSPEQGRTKEVNAPAARPYVRETTPAACTQPDAPRTRTELAPYAKDPHVRTEPTEPDTAVRTPAVGGHTDDPTHQQPTPSRGLDDEATRDSAPARSTGGLYGEPRIHLTVPPGRTLSSSWSRR